jgi:ankyrin repeat protein
MAAAHDNDAAPLILLLSTATLAARLGFGEVTRVSRLCRAAWADVDLTSALEATVVVAPAGGRGGGEPAAKRAKKAAAAAAPPPEPPLRRTRLVFAARRGLADRVTVLLAAGADPNALGLCPARVGGRPVDDAVAPLAAAAAADSPAAVRPLVAAGASLDGPGAGNRPLCISAANGSLRAMVALLEAGASMVGRGLLISAAKAPSPSTALVLLAAGASPKDVRRKVTTGRNRWPSALHAAADHGRVHTVRALIAAGARVNASAADDGITPLMVAADGATAKALLAAGANHRKVSVGINSASALVHAARARRLDVIAALLSAGADVNQCVHVDDFWDGYHSTEPAFRTALLAGWMEGARMLLNAGADPGITAEGCVAPDPNRFLANKYAYGIEEEYNLAMRHDDLSLVAMLLAAGRNPSTKDFSTTGMGRTPLTMAMEDGKPQFARLLRAAGAVEGWDEDEDEDEDWGDGAGDDDEEDWEGIAMSYFPSCVGYNEW